MRFAVCLLSVCWLFAVCLTSHCWLSAGYLLSIRILTAIFFTGVLRINYFHWRTLFPMSQITIRNLGQDVRERLQMHAKANGRSLEAQIRVMLTAMVGLGPSEHDMAGMQAQMKAMRLADEQAMFGTMVRMDGAKKNNLATEISRLVKRSN